MRFSCNAHCPESVHGIRWGCVCNETFGGPGCNVRSCPHCPLHSLCLDNGDNFYSELTGSWTRARCDTHPCPNNCSGLEGATKQWASANVTCNTRGRTAARKPQSLFLSPYPLVTRHGGRPTWVSAFRPDVDRSVPETSLGKLPSGTGRRSASSHNIFQ